MMLKVNSLNDLEKVSRDFLLEVGDAKVFAFQGEMGVGKTTFIKSLCKILGVEDDINSPTFAIVNEYESKQIDKPIYHFDFYRINDIGEVFDMGYEDYFYSNSYCFIEWPEKIDGLLPLDTIMVTITENEDSSRTINIQKISKK